MNRFILIIVLLISLFNIDGKYHTSYIALVATIISFTLLVLSFTTNKKFFKRLMTSVWLTLIAMPGVFFISAFLAGILDIRITRYMTEDQFGWVAFALTSLFGVWIFFDEGKREARLKELAKTQPNTAQFYAEVESQGFFSQCLSGLSLGIFNMGIGIPYAIYCAATGKEDKLTPEHHPKLFRFVAGAGKAAAVGAVIGAMSDATNSVDDAVSTSVDFDGTDVANAAPSTDSASFAPSLDGDASSNVINSGAAAIASGTVSNVAAMSPDDVFSQLSVIGTNDSGFETVSYNADNHTFYNHDGYEIAHVQGNQVVDSMNNVIATYDSNTGNLLDPNGNALNVQQTGETFKTVTDVHGNGTEVINGEVFDAKTHERIGNIRKV